MGIHQMYKITVLRPASKDTYARCRVSKFVVYHGDFKCMRVGCTAGGQGRPAGAYWEINLLRPLYLCGVCSGRKEYKSNRKELPKRTTAQIKERTALEDKAMYEDVEKHRILNVERKVVGKVIISRLSIMGAFTREPGYLPIFPNNKHQNKGGGWGCASMSPMRLGPVYHGQPGLPVALNIENFHQGSKCYEHECIRDIYGNLVPGPIYYANREKFYNDPIPHRHKFERGMKPLYFVWRDRDGREHFLNGVRMRQFYCTFYERLVQKAKSLDATATIGDFERLGNMIRNGINIQITGPDGFELDTADGETNLDKIYTAVYKAYNDPNVPFGHERVIYTMLMLPNTHWPWKTYKEFDF